ncbi:MAG: carboxymuconolactone decarboxylase family protein [Gemmatimonadales bacterium]
MGSKELVEAVLDDYRTAPISERERVLFGFVEKMNRTSNALRVEDVAQVTAAGWTEEAIYDAITVCALFNFYNRWVDAAGVSDLPEYQASGERLANHGYIPAAS